MGFGDRLRKARRAQDLTRKELEAQTAGEVKARAIESYEQGRRTQPSYRKVVALAKALKKRPEDLAG